MDLGREREGTPVRRPALHIGGVHESHHFMWRQHRPRRHLIKPPCRPVQAVPKIAPRPNDLAGKYHHRPLRRSITLGGRLACRQNNRGITAKLGRFFKYLA
jgi:hypothetical protein